jgi:outer membrane lipoprotein-sorting protein
MRLLQPTAHLLALFTLLAGACPLRAAEPTGEQVLDKYVEATGGKNAYEAITSRVVEGTISMPAQGLNGKMVAYSKRPNLVRMTIDFPQIGKVERGYDGTTGWEKSALQGSRILTGDELDHMKQEANMANEANWRDQFSEAKNVGGADLNGKSAYKIELSHKNGKKETRWYDQTSGLLLQSEMDVDTPQAKVHVVATPSDYRDTGGIKMPFKSTQQIEAAGQQIQQIIELSKVEQNVKVADEQFKLPEDIAAMVKEQAKPAGAK